MLGFAAIASRINADCCDCGTDHNTNAERHADGEQRPFLGFAGNALQRDVLSGV